MHLLQLKEHLAQTRSFGLMHLRLLASEIMVKPPFITLITSLKNG
jgi:hypothetical protein